MWAKFSVLGAIAAGKQHTDTDKWTTEHTKTGVVGSLLVLVNTPMSHWLTAIQQDWADQCFVERESFPCCILLCQIHVILWCHIESHTNIWRLQMFGRQTLSFVQRHESSYRFQPQSYNHILRGVFVFSSNLFVPLFKAAKSRLSFPDGFLVPIRWVKFTHW
jgi:hypothetical protein